MRRATERCLERSILGDKRKFIYRRFKRVSWSEYSRYRSNRETRCNQKIRKNNTMETRTCKRCGQEKPIDQFRKNRLGFTNVCLECARSKRQQTMANKEQEERVLTLADFTPRELMEELYRRGFKGKLTFTETHIIDIANI